ncbi:hypothetical protein N0V86_008447 [Didymella sp. IMI 355093]|nr:hypothetical protein N0V86_008447 [Didymella sp. IMI 355093]
MAMVSILDDHHCIEETSEPVEERPQPHQEQSLAPQLLSTTDDLNTEVTDLTTAVDNFDGSFLGLLPQAFAVVKTEAKFDLTILKVASITEKSTDFSAEESKNLVH